MKILPDLEILGDALDDLREFRAQEEAERKALLAQLQEQLVWAASHGLRPDFDPAALSVPELEEALSSLAEFDFYAFA